MTFRTRIVTACTVLLLLALLGRFAPGTPSTQDLAAWTAASAASSSFSLHERDESGWPRKIWQTWRGTVPDMGDELRWFAETWPKLNPDYRYEIMIDDQALTFVRENFVGRPDIIRVFENIRDSTIRADYFRYLMVLAEGGVYADIDLSCEKPIDEWIPEVYRNDTGLVVGISYDARGGDIPENFLAVHLCQWTFMARKRNEVMSHVVDRLTLSIENYLKPRQNPWEGPKVDDLVHAKVCTDNPRVSVDTMADVRRAGLYKIRAVSLDYAAPTARHCPGYCRARRAETHWRCPLHARQQLCLGAIALGQPRMGQRPGVGGTPLERIRELETHAGCGRVVLRDLMQICCEKRPHIAIPASRNGTTA